MKARICIVIAAILAALVLNAYSPSCDTSISTQHCCQMTGDGKSSCGVSR